MKSSSLFSFSRRHRRTEKLFWGRNKIMSRPRGSEGCKVARWKSCIVELEGRTGLKPHSDLVRLWTSSVGISFLICKMRGLDSELKVKCSFIWHSRVLLKVFTQKLDCGKRCLVILHFLPKACVLCFQRGSQYSRCISCTILLSGSVWVWPVGDNLQENWELNEIELFFPLLLPALMCWVHKSSFYGAPLLSLPPQTY